MSRPATAVYVVAILGSLLIMVALVSIVQRHTGAPPVDAKRAAERRKAAADVMAAAKDQLESYGYVDAAKGSVRIPIERAMEMVVHDWKDAQAGRSNLIARFDKLNPAPVPQAPQPSQFE